MYFDLEYYRRVVAHVWSLHGWAGRNRLLFRLLILVPSGAAFHALCFMLDYLLFPKLWRQEVRQPVFVVGHARSGSTLLHRLMAADGETFSYFLYWETFFPSLLQKKVLRAIERMDLKWLGGLINRRLVAWDEAKFGPSRHIHSMSLWNSEEDQFVMRAAFVTQQWAIDVPMLDIIDIFHVDQMPERKKRRWLRYYRECVKRQLLLNGGERIHLSKNPVLSGWVAALIETFPDARFAVVMRDPAQCIPSVMKLMQFSWRSRRWEPADYTASMQAMIEISFDTFRNPHAVLANNPLTPQIVVDYRALTAQPRAAVHAVYSALGQPVSGTFDAYLLAQQRRERSHSSHFSYTIKEFHDYGLSRERIESELAEFYEAFDWPRVESA